MQSFPQILLSDDENTRITALKRIEKSTFPEKTGRTVEHIHSTCSFSPYTPSAAAYMARINGASCAGIVDHDTMAGADEFVKACAILEITPLLGLECRVLMNGTAFEGRHLNNPDQRGLSYMTMQRVPEEKAGYITDFLRPYREKRLLRLSEMTKSAASVFPETELSFEKDVLPLSEFGRGGTVTERHLLFALAKKLYGVFGREKLVFALENAGIPLSGERREKLADENNPYFLYDLAHVLKSELTGKIYIPAQDECMTFSEFVSLSQSAGALCCYAYLGDVDKSVTDDKRAGEFEDGYLPELLAFLKKSGVDAVTHSRKRNSNAQTERLLRLCAENGLLTVEGEDINSPRQAFC